MGRTEWPLYLSRAELKTSGVTLENENDNDGSDVYTTDKLNPRGLVRAFPRPLNPKTLNPICLTLNPQPSTLNLKTSGVTLENENGDDGSDVCTTDQMNPR